MSTINYNSRGEAYRGEGDMDRAIADYTEAIRLDPKYTMAYSNRAAAYRSKGDIDRAIADYTEALRLDPKNAHVYVNRGLACEKLADFARARSDSTLRLDCHKRDRNGCRKGARAACHLTCADPDRIGQPLSSDQVAPVAHRVVLFDEDPSDPKGRQYVGTVIWRTEPIKAIGSQKPDIAVRVDFEIPDRKFKMTMSFRHLSLCERTHHRQQRAQTPALRQAIKQLQGEHQKNSILREGLSSRRSAPPVPRDAPDLCFRCAACRWMPTHADVVVVTARS